MSSDLVLGVTESERAEAKFDDPGFELTPMKKVLANNLDTLAVTCLSKDEDQEKARLFGGAMKAGLFTSSGVVNLGLGANVSARSAAIEQKRHEHVGAVRLEREVTGTSQRMLAGAGPAVTFGTPLHASDIGDGVRVRNVQNIGGADSGVYAEVFHKGVAVRTTMLEVNGLLKKNSHRVISYEKREDFVREIDRRIGALAKQLATDEKVLQKIERDINVTLLTAQHATGKPPSDELRAKVRSEAMLRRDEIANELVNNAAAKIRRFLDETQKDLKPTHSFVTFEEIASPEIVDKVNHIRARERTARAIAIEARERGRGKLADEQEDIANIYLEQAEQILKEPATWRLNYLMVIDAISKSESRGVNMLGFFEKPQDLSVTHLRNFFILK